MPQELNSSIYLIVIIFHTIIISLSKTLFSIFFQFFIFLIFNLFRGLSWKDPIFSHTKQASVRLSVLRFLQNTFSLPRLLSVWKFFAPSIEYALHRQWLKVESLLLQSSCTIAITIYIHLCFELSSCIPPFRRGDRTRLSKQFHPFSVQFCNPRFNRCPHSYIYSTDKIWKILIFSFSPPIFTVNVTI